MKPTIVDQLTWQDIREITTMAHRMSTIPESKRVFETPEEYYGEILAKLKARAKKEE